MIRSVLNISKNLYHIDIDSCSVDTYITLSIDGNKIHYFDIINMMYPKKMVDFSEVALMQKRLAMMDPLLEFKYINFVYKKKVLSKKFIKQIWEEALNIDSHSFI